MHRILKQKTNLNYFAFKMKQIKIFEQHNLAVHRKQNIDNNGKSPCIATEAHEKPLP
jgi:hypothetical protein